jgi:hypothetical protein
MTHVITDSVERRRAAPRRARARTTLATLGFALGFVSRTAVAQPSTDEADRVNRAAKLFDEAKALMDKSNFPEACPKLAESEGLDPQVGTLLNLAVCYELTHMTASACATWRDAAAAAGARGQAERAELGRERAERACSQAPQIVVNVTPQAGEATIAVTLANAALPREQWGVPTKLDPGEYEVRATESGHQPWSARFVVDEAHAPVVTVPALTPLPAPASTPAEGPAAPTRSRALVTAAWVSAGIGVAAVGVGVGFGVAAMNSVDASNESGRCVGNNCNAEGSSDRDRARHQATVADVGFIAGGAALISGAVLWVVASHLPKASSSGLLVRPAIGRDGASLTVGRAW